MENNRDIRVDSDRLEAVMRERGMSIASLAEKMGMHYNSVLRIKKEESTSLQSLEKLCDALECHPLDLLVMEGYPEPFMGALVSH